MRIIKEHRPKPIATCWSKKPVMITSRANGEQNDPPRLATHKLDRNAHFASHGPRTTAPGSPIRPPELHCCHYSLAFVSEQRNVLTALLSGTVTMSFAQNLKCTRFYKRPRKHLTISPNVESRMRLDSSKGSKLETIPQKKCTQTETVARIDNKT